MSAIPETGVGYFFLPRYPADYVNGTRNDKNLIVPAPGQPIDTVKCRFITTQLKGGGHEIRILIEPFGFAPNIAGPSKTQTFYQMPISFGRIVAGIGCVSNVAAAGTTPEHMALMIPEPVSGTDFVAGFFIQNNASDLVVVSVCQGGMCTIITDQ